jgi:hypothetical protein
MGYSNILVLAVLALAGTLLIEESVMSSERTIVMKFETVKPWLHRNEV